MKFLVSLLLSLFLSCNFSKKLNKDFYFSAIDSQITNINFSNDLSYMEGLNIIDYLYYYNGGGVAIGDINNDGWEDIYFTANQKTDKLYLNKGNFIFEDITEKANILPLKNWSTGVSMADVNNDGFLDIYVCVVGNYKKLKGKNLLYINKGDGTFIESAQKYGLAFSGFSTQASFFDYDRDGDLDMYLLNHSVHSINSYGKSSKRLERDSLAGDRLYENKLNEKEKSFVDVSAAARIYNSSLGYGLGLKTVDINNDGWVDIYVGNDFHENDYIYINQGDKTFIERGQTKMGHTSRFTMGIDIADLNNDFFSDIFTLDMMPYSASTYLKSSGEDTDKIMEIKKQFGYGNQMAYNNFQINDQKGNFSEIGVLTNTYATDWSWSVLLEDFDNNTYQDIFITNGIYKSPNNLDYINFISNIPFQKYRQKKKKEVAQKIIKNIPTKKIENILFLNQGNLYFKRQTEEVGLKPTYSNGAATADLDNDGDLDIVINNINQKATLLKNEQKKTKSFINLELKGNDSYPVVFNTKIFVYARNKKLYRELAPVKGFQSSSSQKVHLGLGTIKKIDSVKIIWGDGKKQQIKNPTINNTIYIKRQEKIKSYNYPIKKASLITPFPFKHKENYYFDYERETLIPEKLSKEGPAVAEADFNNDGYTDVFIGGARYQNPVLLFQDKNGNFQKQQVDFFIQDSYYEDIDAATFDFENDGDIDIYVVRGGGDLAEGHAHFENRLYLNDGKGNFEIYDKRLPITNAGSVAIEDFDNDGYQDVFIGGRSVPGAYGLTPYSYLLKNQKGKGFQTFFKQRLGMITDSQWADINNDNFLDLIVVGDWMNVTIFLNQKGKNFQNATEKYNLQNTSGMWNAIEVVDINEDGLKDILVGNAGLNIKWKASIKKPITLYIDDIDKNEQLDPIIFHYFFDKNIPFATRDQIAQQIPLIKKRFNNYEEFSKVNNFFKLTGKKEKDILAKKKIMELRSMLFLQTEKGFQKEALPMQAQWSSIQDFYIQQKQEIKNIFYIGNFLDYTTLLGISDANAGGVITYKNKQLENQKLLPLLPYKSYRKIIKIGQNRFLIATNNDSFFFLEKN